MGNKEKGANAERELYQMFVDNNFRAVRFNRLGWFFINPKDLKDSGKNWVVSLETCQKKGKKFSQFFRDKTKNNNLLQKDLLLKDEELNELIKEDYEAEEN